MKNNHKVVCGTQEGTLAIYTWGTWSDVSDRMLGHPKSVDAIVKITEDVLVTGSSDGLLRVVHIHPNKLIGVIGEHENFPIERIRISGDRAYLGSCSLDQKIKFWSVDKIPLTIPEAELPWGGGGGGAGSDDEDEEEEGNWEDVDMDDSNDPPTEAAEDTEFDYAAARGGKGSFLSDL